MVRTPRTPLLQCSLTKEDTLESTEGLTQLEALWAKKETSFTNKTEVQENLQPQKQSSTERLTTVKHKSSKANDIDVYDNTPVNTARLCYRQTGVLQQGQRENISVFEQLHSRAPSSHTERRKSCYRPLELSHNLQVTCGEKGSHTMCSGTILPGEGTACRAGTWVRKEEQWGVFCHWFCHALLACQVFVTFGFSPG